MRRHSSSPFGIPLEEVIEEAGRLKQDVEQIAGRFASLFLDHLWEPYVRAGMPADQLPRITEALRRLTPLASATTLAFLREAMAEQASAAAGEIIARAQDGQEAESTVET